MWSGHGPDPSQWWNSFMSAAEAPEVPGHSFRTHVPIGSAGVRADAIIQTPDQVTVIETLPIFGSTGSVPSGSVNVVGLIAKQAAEMFPGTNLRIAVFPYGSLPDTVKEDLRAIGAEIISSHYSPAQAARYFFGHCAEEIPAAGPFLAL